MPASCHEAAAGSTSPRECAEAASAHKEAAHRMDTSPKERPSRNNSPPAPLRTGKAHPDRVASRDSRISRQLPDKSIASRPPTPESTNEGAERPLYGPAVAISLRTHDRHESRIVLPANN